MFRNMGGGGDREYNNSRNRTIDFIRGIAILLVVLGHNIQYGSGNDFYQMKNYFDSMPFKFIYSFHMPLFALLSGYLFFGSMKRPMKHVIKKRLISLLLPIFCWVTLENVGKSIILIIKDEFTFSACLYDYASSLVHELWFLWAMFWCSLIVMLVEKVFEGRVWIYGLLIILILFTPARYNFYMYAYMCPYFVAGFLINKFDGKSIYRRVVKNDWHALVVAVAVFAVLFLFYGYDFYIYTTKISLLGENGILVQLGIDIYRWIVGFAGSIAVIILCKMICDRWQGAGVKVFAYFGQISLGIYILNSYANGYVLQRLTVGLMPNVLIWIVETIVSVAVYAAVVEIIKMVPMTRKLLLGGR